MVTMTREPRQSRDSEDLKIAAVGIEVYTGTKLNAVIEMSVAEAQLWQKALLGTASGPEVLYEPPDGQSCVKGTLTSTGRCAWRQDGKELGPGESTHSSRRS